MKDGAIGEEDTILENALEISETVDSTISRHIQRLSISMDKFEDPDDYVEARADIVRYIVKKFINIASHMEFFHSLSDVKFLPSDESKSILFTARLKPTLQSVDTKDKLALSRIMSNGLEVFVKFKLQQEGARHFQNVEKRMYKHVINDLVLERTSPHFMLYYHHFDIRDVDRFMGMQWHRQGPKSYGETLNRHYGEKLSELSLDLPDATVLLLESGHGITFDTYLEQLSTLQDSSSLYVILFQLLYTLTCMDKEGLTHYDLHNGNVFLEELKTPLTTVYFLDATTWVKVTSRKYFVKIFDWEFAYHQGINTKREKQSMEIRACPEIGVCPQHNPKCDLWRLFWFLMEDTGGALPSDIQRWIESGMNLTSSNPNVNLMLRKGLSDVNENFRGGYLCFLPDDEGCDGPLEASNQALKRASWYLKALEGITSSISDIQWGRLPEYDTNYCPNTAQWSNVFAVTSDLREKVRRKLNGGRAVPL